jgi:hypothetical protein
MNKPDVPSSGDLRVDAALLRTKQQKSELGRMLSSLRRTHGGGRKKKLRKCQGCGARLGVREMRAHKCEAKA